MQISDIVCALSYFDAGVVKLNPPASSPAIAASESRLGVAFPTSVRTFLRWHNGGMVASEGLLGINSIDSPLDIESWNKRLRRVNKDDWDATRLIVGTDWCGNYYVASTVHLDERGDAPIGFVDGISLELEYWVASDFLAFLWFYIRRVAHGWYPNGKPVPVDKSLPDYPWPFDHKWMVEHDPQLGRLLSQQT
jgi:hypothetical protein